MHPPGVGLLQAIYAMQQTTSKVLRYPRRAFTTLTTPSTFRHARIWTEFENALTRDDPSSVCLDQARADGWCTRIGMRLQDMPHGLSTFDKG